jgi:hypothetical protein
MIFAGTVYFSERKRARAVHSAAISSTISTLAVFE